MGSLALGEGQQGAQTMPSACRAQPCPKQDDRAELRAESEEAADLTPVGMGDRPGDRRLERAECHWLQSGTRQPAVPSDPHPALNCQARGGGPLRGVSAKEGARCPRETGRTTPRVDTLQRPCNLGELPSVHKSRLNSKEEW